MRTPTIDILTGAQRRTSGTGSVLGRDPQNDEREWRAQVGVVPQGTADYQELTVYEVIDHFATFYPDPFPTGQLIDMVGLRAKTKTYTTKLSGGQRRRLDEAQELSQRIGVIAGGRMLHVGTLDQLAQLTGSRRRVSYDLDPLVEVPPGLATRLESEPHTCLYATDGPTALLRLLLDAAQRRGISELPGLQVTQPSLVAASLARSRVELLTFFRNWMSLIFNMAFPVLLMLVTSDRDEGLIRRLAASPMPRVAYFIGITVKALITTVFEVIILMVLGMVLYGLPMPSDAVRWLTLVWVVLLGVSSCSLLGIAYTELIPNSRAAPAPPPLRS